MSPIKIVIVDDHTLLRETWSFLLNSAKQFEVVATAGSAEEGIQLCKSLSPDVLMLDINLQGMNGIDAVPLIRGCAPDTKIVGVSLHTNPAYVKRMMQNGASGYITKNSPREEMMDALQQVAQGKKYICEEIRNILAEALVTEGDRANSESLLSAREMDVVRLIRHGLSSKEIAARCSISVKTVEVHRYNILKKLKLKNAAALVNHINHYQIAV